MLSYFEMDTLVQSGKKKSLRKIRICNHEKKKTLRKIRICLVNNKVCIKHVYASTNFMSIQ